MSSAEPKTFSRLPRPTPSSPERGPPPTMTLKRKATEDLGKSTKVPALGSRSLRPRAGVSGTSSAAGGRAPLQPVVPPVAARGRAVSGGKGGVAGKSNALGKSVMGRPAVLSPEPVVGQEGWQQMQQKISSLGSIMESERSKVASLESFRSNLQSDLSQAKSLELEHRKMALAASEELESERRKWKREVEDWEGRIRGKERECRDLMGENEGLRGELRVEREKVLSLKSTLQIQSTTELTLQTQLQSLQAQHLALQSQIEYSHSDASTTRRQLDIERNRVAELEKELREAEATRRKLHNLVQELKGNIRVFCRVRPALPNEKETAELAAITYPDRDGREIVLSSTSETAMGGVREEVMPFSFDRVFQPHSTQEEVFEEISQLTRSCIDGYNVCIFAYGQTGAGKSWTMEGGPTELTSGMIPRAVQQVFKDTEELKKQGWTYTMEGQFLEIYNENINDLLGTGDLDKKKHEIKHEKNGRTVVTDVVTVPLESPAQVRTLLLLAQSRRTVHATLMNERSSRSHSVFTLRISGVNNRTNETCEGSLNLVDLAGSERLNSSGAANDKDRLKETQNINRSLSALGDVIASLGEKATSGGGGGGKEWHVPYRNSKLTYLLQNSLSGNSKTLMVLNVSPLASSLGESLCSLRFATKVNNTSIGTARKQVGTKPSS